MDKSIERDRIVYRGRGVGWWERGMYMHRKGSVDQTDTSWLSGGSCVIRRSYFVLLHGFDEIYSPFYWEDVDLSYRAQKWGYRLVFEPRSIVIHEHDSGAIKTSYSKRTITRIAYRNQILFVWRNATIMQFLVHLVWLPYHMLQTLRRFDFLFMLAYVDAVIRLLQFRTVQQKS